MRPSLVLLSMLSVSVSGCGGDGVAPIHTARDYCESLAAAWCDRFYDCYGPEVIDEAGLPRTAGDCARELELDMQCLAVTDDNVCGAGFELDLADAGACVGGVEDAVCSLLPDLAEVGSACDDACVPIDGPDDCDDDTCNPADPAACDAGSACRLDGECVAVCDDEVGPGRALADCVDDGDCAAGFRCAEEHLCTELCDDTHACGIGRVCNGTYHADAGVSDCSDGCIPGRDECPPGLTCDLATASTGETYCVLAGTGAELSACTTTSDCADPLACFDGYCRLGCDHDNLCPNNRTCYGWTPTVTIGTTILGLCQ